jgi:hypothetical protein
MNADYSEGDTSLRTIEADDVAGICAAYDPARAGTCDPMPRGGLADECLQTSGTCACLAGSSEKGAAASGLGAFAVLSIAVLRVRRRRPIYSKAG